tara:strand:- start:528 stop:680 length:153 start_codon:yes stop_codon:yes gene_type:complete
MDKEIIEIQEDCKFGLDTCSNKGLFCEECDEGDNYELWENLKVDEIKIKL